LTEFRFFLPDNEESDQDSAENDKKVNNEGEGEGEEEEEKGEIKEENDEVSIYF